MSAFKYKISRGSLGSSGVASVMGAGGGP